MALLVVLLLSFTGRLFADCNKCQPADCSDIHACYNCETLMSVSCLQMKTYADAEACKTQLALNTLSRASYVQATGACELSKSKCGIYYSDSIDLLFYKTCNTGCSNYTITRLADMTFVEKEDYSNKSTNFIWCQEQCIPPVQGCSFVYKPDKSDCFVYKSCHGNCTTIPQTGSILYTVTCNGNLNVDCPTLFGPANGSVNTSAGFSPGDKAIYTCKEGYYLNGSAIVTCSSNGTWDYSAPTCTPVDCKPPFDLTNGNVRYSSTMYEARADYDCDSGFTLSGSNYSICTSNATWDPPERECVPEGGTTYKNLYIMPCICYPNKTFVNLTQEEIIKKLIEDTQINTKDTVVAMNKYISRPDQRMSSKAIGAVAIVILLLLCGLILSCDLIKIRASIREVRK